MPPKTRASRARISPPLPEPEKKTRDSIKQNRKSRPLKQWRTSGIVDKQSTLTQIDFIRPANRYDYEDLNLDYEDEGTIQADDTISEPKPKRRRIDTTNKLDSIDRRTSMLASSTMNAVDNKENEVLTSPKKDITALKPVFLTPRKPRTREVLSSQSPTTPLSVKSTRRHLFRMDASPLKDLSVNVPRQPRLRVEDTFKSNDTESSLSRTGSISSEGRTSNSMSKPVHNNGGIHSKQVNSTWKSEILDSDEEVSDTEIVESSQDDELPIILGDLQPNAYRTVSTNLEVRGSDTEIFKLPVSDDSKDGKQDDISAEEMVNSEHENQETDTLDDALLLKTRRTYSGSRRRSMLEDLPSSSVLEEISGAEEMSQSTHTPSKRTNEIPSSPPTVVANKQSQPKGRQEVETNLSQNRILETSSSDSRQATMQLQQESHPQPRTVIPSSQASTASIPSSPIVEEAKAKQSNSSRRGWFFNPLTDSQLLPESIMNFELPRLPRMLGLRRPTPGDDNDKD